MTGLEKEREETYMEETRINNGGSNK